MNPMEMVEREQLRTDLPDFRVGDTVKVHVKIVEGEKERIQPFEGVVIRKKRGRNSLYLYGQEDLLRNRGGEDLSDPFAPGRPDRCGQPGEGEAGETLLPAGPERKGSPHQGREETAAGLGSGSMQ